MLVKEKCEDYEHRGSKDSHDEKYCYPVEKKQVRLLTRLLSLSIC